MDKEDKNIFGDVQEIDEDQQAIEKKGKVIGVCPIPTCGWKVRENTQVAIIGGKIIICKKCGVGFMARKALDQMNAALNQIEKGIIPANERDIGKYGNIN